MVLFAKTLEEAFNTKHERRHKTEFPRRCYLEAAVTGAVLIGKSGESSMGLCDITGKYLRIM